MSENPQAENGQGEASSPSGNISKSKMKAFLKEIAAQLGETDEKPLRQIRTLTLLRGMDFVRELVAETLQVEADGGLMIGNGERRRTTGGVFFFLARERLPQPERDKVFFNWKVAARQRNEHEAQFAPFVWEERASVVQALMANQGVASDVKIIIVGQPGSIERRQNLVVTTITEKREELPSMPIGVPPVPTEPMTYVVYIAAKQWDRIANIVGDPDDPMLVEGYCAFDPEVNSFAVYATYATTKKSDQREKKAAKASTSAKGQTGKGGGQNGKGDGKAVQPRKDSGGDKPKAKRAEEPVVVEAPPAPEYNFPSSVPAHVAQKLVDLYTAATAFRQKISDLESKPAHQQTGLEMTRRLLTNTERQIEALEKQYAVKG
jgi:hypothetical protein